MNTGKKTNLFTLEAIKAAKYEKLEQIRAKQASILSLTHRITAPVSNIAQNGRSLSKSVGTGMAILQGVITGLQIMRKFQSLFKRRSR